jgi:beta-phosphoglucomutase-like phosphatase (HAD superfamily)
VIDTLKEGETDPEVFLCALEELKATPSNTIFIGDK